MNVKQELTIHEISDLPRVAESLILFCDGRKKLAFYGEIGAGKTTLIKALCQLLKVEDQVSSPTYALVNEYEYPQGIIHHLDLYRLKSFEEALEIGIEDYLDDERYCFVEWPEIIENLLPDDVVTIHIKQIENSSRNILFCKNQ